MTAKKIIEIIKKELKNYQEMSDEYKAKGDRNMVFACDNRVEALRLLLERIKREGKQ